MDISSVTTVISTLGFPIAACIALFVGCKYMLDNQQKNTEKMFEMYDKANIENREAIKACTEAINKLCDKLDDVRG
jgi:hypothetical protein